MVTHLNIENTILVEKASIDFSLGLHIFSGETGAGKTALMQALSLTLGKKSDPQIIRKGCEKAKVSAQFEPSNPAIYSILKDAGIEIETSEPLFIQREISINGKNKTLINNQGCSLYLLKQISKHLIDIVSQNASLELLAQSYHQKILDQVASHQNILDLTSISYRNLKNANNELEKLKQLEREDQSLRIRKEEELNELNQIEISSEDDDEILFNEYQKLNHSSELKNTSHEIYYDLIEADPNLLSNLKLLHSKLQKLAALDSNLNLNANSFLASIEALQEDAYSLLNYSDSVEENSQKPHDIDNKLKIIEVLKKRYGPSLKEVITYKEKLSHELEKYLDLGHKKQDLLVQIEALDLEHKNNCNILTKSRSSAKGKLLAKMETLLKDLNLEKATFSILFRSIEPSSIGQEEIEFYFKANPGENDAPLKSCASGGELARVLLALKAVQFELEDMPTLIFDEIDSSVGGETALKLAQLLKKLSKNKQILSITHQAQVAASGDIHYLIEKKEINQRTYSLVQRLDLKARQKELERMLGGENLSSKARDLANDLLR